MDDALSSGSYLIKESELDLEELIHDVETSELTHMSRFEKAQAEVTRLRKIIIELDEAARKHRKELELERQRANSLEVELSRRTDERGEGELVEINTAINLPSLQLMIEDIVKRLVFHAVLNKITTQQCFLDHREVRLALARGFSSASDTVLSAP